MPAIDHFHNSLAAANDLIEMYWELRRARDLGRRGRLDAANLDLLSLPRAAVVASVSALDAYIHEVLYDRIPIVLRAPQVPIPLCDLMSNSIQIRNGTNFQEALPVLIAQDSLAELFRKVRREALGFFSYQAPEKIIGAYALLGYPAIFDLVAALWPGPGTAAEDLKRNLSSYVKRRNQIAHEGDQEANGRPRPMRPQYAQGCRDFMWGLATRLNRVVYNA
jgi:hypothetical protein